MQKQVQIHVNKFCKDKNMVALILQNHKTTFLEFSNFFKALRKINNFADEINNVTHCYLETMLILQKNSDNFTKAFPVQLTNHDHRLRDNV